MTVLADTALTFSQLPERAMRAPLVKGVVATLLVMIALGVTVGAWISWLLSGWTIPFTDIAIGGAGGWLAGFGSLAAMIYVFVPAAAIAVSFFIDPVADAVEAKHYADAPPARGRPLAQDLLMAAKTGVLALLINIPLIPFYFLFPPLPALVNGYLLGREYFTLAALRRHTPREAAALRSRARLDIWMGGALLALMVTVPLLNLIAPVFGAGLMTHTYNRARVRAERGTVRL